MDDAGYSAGETFPIVLNSIAGAGVGNGLIIKPNIGTTVNISGSSATSIIKLNGADYVTIDGSNNGTNTRNLTISNNNSGTSSGVVWLASATVSDGATNNVIKNLVLSGNSSSTTLMGIFSGGTTTMSTSSVALVPNANNTYQNNQLLKSQYGIYVIGVSTTTLGSGLIISNNLLGTSNLGEGFQNEGITIKFQSGATVTGNDV